MNNPPKHIPEDFSDLENLMVVAANPDTPKEMLHGTPAIVIRNLDQKRYRVLCLFYDGDKKGFTITIETPEGLVDLVTGQYRPYALFVYDDQEKSLNIQVLE